MGGVLINKVDLDHRESFVGWIHQGLPRRDQDLRVREAALRLAGSSWRPRELVVGGERVAGVYFLPLPGHVATLGGCRQIDGLTERLEVASADGGKSLGPSAESVSLLRECVEEARNDGIEQIQAVVSGEDKATLAALEKAGFSQLTSVLHLWVELPDVTPHPIKQNQAYSTCEWMPAHELGEAGLASLIAETFRYTLDCPALNGIRSESEVLAGFLDGSKLKQLNHWRILQLDGKTAGCLFLTPHSANSVELVYLGLIPDVRGQGLGALLVEKALELTRSIESTVVIAAVDVNNWPALQIYESYGFQRHTSLEVFLYSP